MDPTSSVAPELVHKMQQLTFGWSDYTLFGGLFGVSLFIGIYFGFFSKQDSANEYLFGGKKMAYLPVAMSVLASLLSGVTFLGLPTEAYFHGAYFAVNVIPGILSYGAIAYLIVPIFYDLQLSSSFEYLELRFSKTIRLLASFLYIVALMLYVPIVIYVPALAFSQATGYSIHTIAPVFSLICITYTAMGGVKAVVWTDTIQLFFTVGGLFTVLVIGVHSVGGLTEMWRIAGAGGRLDIFDMNPSLFARNTFWGVTFGNFFLNIFRLGIGPKFIQRILAIEKEVDIKKATLLVILGWLILNLCCILTGLIIYAKYHDCDPLAAKFIKRKDQILPYYVMDIAGHIYGLPGIFLAGLVSSSLSSMSASLNTLSGLIYEDFVDKWIAESPNKDKKSANIMKFISVIIGLILIAMIFVIEHLGTIFEMANSLSTIVDGPLLGFFVLGMFFPWAGKKGTISGGCVSIAVMTWIVGGSQWHILNKRIRYSNLPTSTENCPNETLQHTTSTTMIPPLASEDEPLMIFRTSLYWLLPVGMIITVVVGLIVSLIVKESDPSKVNPKYIVPLFRGFLPEKTYIEVPLKNFKDVPQEIKNQESIYS